MPAHFHSCCMYAQRLMSSSDSFSSPAEADEFMYEADDLMYEADKLQVSAPGTCACTACARVWIYDETDGLHVVTSGTST